MIMFVTCRHCGAANPPSILPQRETPPEPEEPQIILTLEKGASPAPGATPLFWND